MLCRCLLLQLCSRQHQASSSSSVLPPLRRPARHAQSIDRRDCRRLCLGCFHHLECHRQLCPTRRLLGPHHSGPVLPNCRSSLHSCSWCVLAFPLDEVFRSRILISDRTGHVFTDHVILALTLRQGGGKGGGG